jgi:uncharacterized membrane-anchored protein YitT (DUF2179 family)
MNWSGFTLGLIDDSHLARWVVYFIPSVKDPELAPHSYLMYLLVWTFLVGFFVLFIFPVIGSTLGFIIITLMIILFVWAIWFFHNNQIFAD